jgi:hypothetical protein
MRRLPSDGYFDLSHVSGLGNRRSGLAATENTPKPWCAH